MRQVDRVQLHGWTGEAVTIAAGTLTGIVAGNNAGADPEARALAVELARWVACAARADPGDLAARLDDLRPSGADASPWEQLESLLASEQDIDSLMSTLLARETDLGTTLCLLLSARVSPDEEYDDLYPMYARAVEILVRLGTTKSAEYLVAHAGLLWWADDRPLEQLVAPHRDVFAAAACKVWPALDWSDRILVLRFLRDCNVPDEDVIALLWDTDDISLTYKERYGFVEALLNVSFDLEDRPLDIVRNLIARCSDDPSTEARDFVAFAKQELACIGIDWKAGTQSAPAYDVPTALGAPGSTDA